MENSILEVQNCSRHFDRRTWKSGVFRLHTGELLHTKEGVSTFDSAVAVLCWRDWLAEQQVEPTRLEQSSASLERAPQNNGDAGAAGAVVVAGDAGAAREALAGPGRQKTPLQGRAPHRPLRPSQPLGGPRTAPQGAHRGP